MVSFPRDTIPCNDIRQFRQNSCEINVEAFPYIAERLFFYMSIGMVHKVKPAALPQGLNY